MAARCFIDTNILVYTQASDEPARQAAALALLRQLYESGTGVLSTQVLNEYCNVALKKLRLPAETILAQLEFFGQFEVVQVTPALIRAALLLHAARSLSFYDALILASAQAAGCTVLYSEDLNTGEQVGAVRIVNPLPR
jgi:predicted nucleic acid-binding protein